MPDNSDSEDDYLSEKFLVDAAAPTTKPQTYAERRRAAQREAEIKQERNRKLSRRELEEETRKEGLSTSLFARAQEDGGNKAMSMMMKMGFKVGQSLGRIDDETPTGSSSSIADDAEIAPVASQHRVEPLPVGMWQGRKGVGLGKRAASPGASERQAKVARVEDERKHDDFRGRARSDWEDRRAEGRLAAARRTCISLDEKAGKDFNVFWLDPADPSSFPPGLLDALQTDLNTDQLPATWTDGHRVDDDDQDAETTGIPTAALALRLQREMRQHRDALNAVEDETAATAKQDMTPMEFSSEQLDQANDFLVMPPVARLDTLLAYLRQEYSYCFWCGAQYDDEGDLQENCPGPDEASHD